MGVIDMVHKMQEKKQEHTEKFKQREEELKIDKIITQRGKSSDERYLERLAKEDRERKIHAQVLKLNKAENEKNWKSNVFKNETPHGKNIFANNPNHSLKSNIPFLSGKGGFK